MTAPVFSASLAQFVRFAEIFIDKADAGAYNKDTKF